MGCGQEARLYLGRITGVVGGYLQRCPGREAVSQQVQEAGINQPAVVMGRFGPGIGEVDKNPGRGAGGEENPHAKQRVGVEQADVGQAGALQPPGGAALGRQRNLQADDVPGRVAGGQITQELAIAKANLQVQRRFPAKNGCPVGRPGQALAL